MSVACFKSSERMEQIFLQSLIRYPSLNSFTFMCTGELKSKYALSLIQCFLIDILRTLRDHRYTDTVIPSKTDHALPVMQHPFFALLNVLRYEFLCFFDKDVNGRRRGFLSEEETVTFDA